MIAFGHDSCDGDAVLAMSLGIFDCASGTDIIGFAYFIRLQQGDAKAGGQGAQQGQDKQAFEIHAQALSHDHGAHFVGFRQQDGKFLSAIACHQIQCYGLRH